MNANDRLFINDKSIKAICHNDVEERKLIISGFQKKELNYSNFECLNVAGLRRSGKENIENWQALDDGKEQITRENRKKQKGSMKPRGKIALSTIKTLPHET